ncbi:TIGR01777 family oxidoreductase [Paenibacillus sp. DXFW5]|uniref:TIGR01777 family oxidoreductase n=1 Tax=Paenibacillus rhizolycopersici TaxID=2780073 RepID=A0ABS2H4Q3_9BACL|nr:TIGR01777 family oxidoreductase [Paenibacillus rhizolycopersici]MBM6994448.1 TIGR01777 family oxidoreductase [Paenibacillus rhizolycopersici]
MKTVIFGGSGFIGRALAKFWLSQGHEVMIVTRGGTGGKRWLQEAAASDALLTSTTWLELERNPVLLEGVSTIVNLAGATLNQRWSKPTKQRILESRLESTRAVARAVERMKLKPEVVVQGSAVGIYGTSLSESFDESSSIPSPPPDFLAEVTTAWEETADREFRGIRVVKLRTGVVLGQGGGAYPLMRLPYQLGIGGSIGSGKQWVPWIHIQDMVRLIDYCATHPEVRGPVNAVSPHPVTNLDFGRTVCRVHRRPFWLPLPAAVLRAALGEMSLLLLEGQQVIPRALLEAGFTFTYPDLESAVADLKS